MAAGSTTSRNTWSRPRQMPEHLTWHKWQSYTTWLSGAALLMIVYWVGGELFLLDPTKADLALWQGILISGGSLTIGWLVYDCMCKSKLGEQPTAADAAAVRHPCGDVLGLQPDLHRPRGAAASGGVHRHDHDGQRVLSSSCRTSASWWRTSRPAARRMPKYGKIAKLRSTHNNYLTLPVIFLMLSNHYPLAFGTEYAWIIASLVFLTGVTIRHYFNTMHATGKGPHWTWARDRVADDHHRLAVHCPHRRYMGRGRSARADPLRAEIRIGRRV